MKSFDTWTKTLTGQCLIEASAGTGKTYTLAALYLRFLIEKQSLLPENILVLTFTNAATSELKTRLREQLIQAKLHLSKVKSCEDSSLANYLDEINDSVSAIQKLSISLQCFDQAAIYTIHGFCKKIIEDFNSECGSPVFHELTDPRDHLDHWIYDFMRKQLNDKPQRMMLFAPKIESLKKKINSLLSKKHFPDASPITNWEQFCEFETKLGNLQEQWQSQQEILLDYLLSGDLKAMSYNLKKREQYKQQISNFFNGKLDAPLKNYHASNIQNSYKKNIEPKPIPEFFYEFENCFNRIYNLAHKANLVEIAFVYECWLSVKKQQQKMFNNEGLFGFDDQIETIYNATKESETLRKNISEQWSVLLVDEFQDTDSMQLSIFENCFLNQQNDVVLVGDPKQAIYDFRGGDVFVYQKAKEKIKKHYSLQTNWRSSSDMLAATNKLFAFPESFHLDWIRFESSKPKPIQAEYISEPDKALQIIDSPKENRLNILSNEIKSLLTKTQIKSDLNTRNISEGDIAIIVNSNQEAKSTYQALLMQGLNVSLWSDANVMETETAKELFYLIRAINQLSLSNINTSLHSHFFGFGINQIHKIVDEDRLQQFIEFRMQLQKKSFSVGLQELIQDNSIHHQLLTNRDGERRWTDLQHLLELIADTFKQKQSLDVLQEWLSTEISDSQILSEDDQRKRKLESDGEKITILTIHKSKGLEYSIVFMPFADAIKEKISSKNSGSYKFVESLHDKNFNGFINWQVDDHTKDQLEIEHIAVQRRKLYVALTRSKFRLYLGIDSKNEKQFKNTTISELLEHSDVNYFETQPQEVSYSKQTTKDLTELSYNSCKRTLNQPTRISSFSGLTPNEQHGLYDPEENLPIEIDYNDYMQFPKGSLSGSLQHEVFEEIDFNNSLDKIKPEVERILKKYQFDLRWTQCLSIQIKTILGTPLVSNGPKLSDLKNIIVEMEFLLPFNEENTHKISNWLSEHRGQSTTFKFNSIQGFLSGFIDLIFEHNGQYFILDYKSNHLGNDHESYSFSQLEQSIQDHHYDLQYLLYSVALIKTLQIRIPDFDFDKHYGGVYYLYTRGVNGKASEGIYFNKPSKKLLKKMMESFNV